MLLCLYDHCLTYCSAAVRHVPLDAGLSLYVLAMQDWHDPHRVLCTVSITDGLY